jgi:hypothetical protein
MSAVISSTNAPVTVPMNIPEFPDFLLDVSAFRNPAQKEAIAPLICFFFLDRDTLEAGKMQTANLDQI